jgi:hypothetical protein
VNCFEFETGALLKKNDSGLGSGGHSGLRSGSVSSGLRGGGSSRLKVFWVIREEEYAGEN